MKSDSLKRNRLGTQSQHSTHKLNSSARNRSHKSSHSRSMIMKSTHLHLNRSSMTMRRIYYYQILAAIKSIRKFPKVFSLVIVPILQTICINNFSFTSRPLPWKKACEHIANLQKHFNTRISFRVSSLIKP